ncbi:MAG: YggT family protein [Solirubrobacterales bacterium]
MISAITRVDIADYLSTLIWIYTILILVRILLTWIPRIPYNPVLRSVIQFVEDVTNPYLNLFRRLIPPLNVGGGGLDLSPILAILTLSIVGGIIVNLIAG